MVALTFPDGARRDYPNGITGLDVARGISPSLARRTVAMALDGALTDLNDPIERDAKIEFLSRDDPRALELIRHDCAHVLAEAGGRRSASRRHYRSSRDGKRQHRRRSVLQWHNRAILDLAGRKGARGHGDGDHSRG